jgi:formylglycine-generating enzyme required for sulfatase activity
MKKSMNCILPVAVFVGFVTCMLPQDVRAQSPKAPRVEPVRLAIEDLMQRFPQRYPRGAEYLARLEEIEKMPAGVQFTEALTELRRKALLDNPLIDFDQILFIRRKEDMEAKRGLAKAQKLGLPRNWLNNSSVRPRGWDSRIAVLEGFGTESSRLRTLHEPPDGALVSHLQLHWDADKFLFSSIDEDDVWHVFEMDLASRDIRRVTPLDLGGDSFDACYLPDQRIVFNCTAIQQVVPCTNADKAIANLFLMNADGTGVRRLCFDQDQDYHPTVTESGTVLFTRWQYSDLAHPYGRVLMQMNPDGTNQREFFGSSSYWPTALFYAKPIPGQPERFVGIVSGHYGNARSGRLMLFDTGLGRREQLSSDAMAPGVVQSIPGRGVPVPAERKNTLYAGYYPQFLHPQPLDGKYFIAACQPTEDDDWGIYLVDVFDNMVLLHEEPGTLLLEPVPVRKRPRPPVIPDRVDLKSKTAQVYIVDIYEGPGLRGVPRGSVKELQLYTFNFPVRDGHRGSSKYLVGMSGPWDMRTILGRVPVAEDGSAYFSVPANTPISLQPLDAEGKAVQVMRSWITAMPGENLSCVGCHEQQEEVPPVDLSNMPLAMRQPPCEIEPVQGPARPFSFAREVQPVLDRRCVGCHNASTAPQRPDLRGVPIDPRGHFGKTRHVNLQDFTWGYCNLQRFVYRHGPEGEMPVLMPMEYHPDTSELVQMLRKGHHGVKLTDEEWERIALWIDLNVPFHGTWTDATGSQEARQCLEKRREVMRRFANLDWTLETIPEQEPEPVEFVAPEDVPAPKGPAPTLQGWPMTQDQARSLQEAGQPGQKKIITIGQKGKIEMAWVPAGAFVMGSRHATPDERPLALTRIEKGFWMSTTEVTNAQFSEFDPEHNSRYLSNMHLRLEELCKPEQPVVRVSWNDTRAFCRWLSQQTGQRIDLPTEAQWEWACRAGSGEDFPDAQTLPEKQRPNCAGTEFGTFFRFDNVPMAAFRPDWQDDAQVTRPVADGQANAWGLKNMHGNAAEWTRSLYKPYPYSPDDGRNQADAPGERVVRGGSFSDRPKRCTSAYRLGYESWRGVYNVGFRIIVRPESE